MRYNLILCGIGGQGIITLSEIVAAAAIEKDIKAIVTQERGLAQRGGSVKAQVRLGEVYSPMIPKHAAHGLLSLERQETWGYLDYVNADTLLAVSNTIVSSEEQVEDAEEAPRLVDIFADRLLLVDAQTKAAELGQPRGVNMFMLGIIFGMDPRLNGLISRSEMVDTIRKTIRRSPAENIELFEAGMTYGQKQSV